MKLVRYGFYIVIIYIVFTRPVIVNIELVEVNALPTHVATFLGTTAKYNMQGVDVSHYQGDVNFKEVERSGIEFVYVKATEGVKYVDPRYHTNVEKLLDTSLLTGAYHFFRPDDDVIDQANHFISRVSHGKHTLPPMLDVEVSGTISRQELSSRVMQWLEYVEKKLQCRPVLFSNAGFWQQYLGPSFDKYIFWLSDYETSPKVPAGLTNWRIWQYSDTAKVKGISNNVDRNVIVKGDIGCHG